MKKEMIILIGIQGAGKSSFYIQRFFNTHIRLSLDVLRTRQRESILLEACLAAKISFVVDNTNVSAADRKRYLLPGKAAGFTAWGYFFEPDVETSLIRNDRREGRLRVPRAAVFRTLKRIEIPRVKEGFERIFRVTVSPSGDFRTAEMHV